MKKFNSKNCDYTTDLQDALDFDLSILLRWLKNENDRRVKKAKIDNLGIIKESREKKGDTNMSNIKKLFGVEIGEEFTVESKYYGAIKNCWFCRAGKLVVPGEGDWETLDLLTELIMGEAKIVKPILDEVELYYLQALCKPYDIEYIKKVTWSPREYSIFIKLTGIGGISLPPFNKYSKMYAGMKPDKKYTPEQLGIKL